MKNKILAFIVDVNKNKFLALHNNPHPDHGGDFWFIVTGEMNENETYKDAIKREVKEETNLNIINLFYLNWGSIYNWNNETCKERNYLVFTNNNKVKLNEENIEFEWLDLEKFVKKIKWDDNKKVLIKVLKKAIKKEKYFKKFKLKDYR